jgi:hypothetical protein
LKVMGDIQEYFVHHQVRNFYSVSISARCGIDRHFTEERVGAGTG